MNKNDVTPFGLLFEEQVIPTGEIATPVYDEDENISVIIDERGNKTPYVESNSNFGTLTITRIKEESTDDDEPQNALGTRTLTEVKEEDSDVDDMVNLFLGTKTTTSVKSEQTDNDPNEIHYELPIMSTITATKAANEDTDFDDE